MRSALSGKARWETLSHARIVKSRADSVPRYIQRSMEYRLIARAACGIQSSGLLQRSFIHHGCQEHVGQDSPLVVFPDWAQPSPAIAPHLSFTVCRTTDC
ncbi:uncharacterized protein RCC_07719 [Ramularia collo-cygni]|uniref:Uncharacterized protein n=1 Tax=Ramularia collo-cygni TaxID=112498 RepID=A0A2D3UVS3_9PEZI|nr:uncharacterized protein RCC_07719 [Ramularia collo-cygni]CZT21852.1 uncharacterized protein RCC_07719 [Ramularia collo-cygni]